MEPEVITACENVCRDFYWVRPALEILANLAIVSGVVIALIQLKSWRLERRQIRMAEVAEDLLANIYEVQDAFRFIRGSHFQLPPDEAKDKDATIQAVHRRIQQVSEQFTALHRSSLRAFAVFGRESLEGPIQVFFDCRSRIQNALEEQFDHLEDSDFSPETRKRKVELRRVIFGRYDENDAIAKALDEAKHELEALLLPVVRLEKS